MDTIPIFIDLIMMGLLIGTIIHSIHLSKSLSAFKKLHREILPIMQEQAKNINHNILQIEQMKKISADIEHVLNSRFPAALSIKDDLEFLISRANKLANSLEETIEYERQKELIPSRSSKPTPKKKSSPVKENPTELTQKVKSKNSTLKPLTESFSLTKTAKKLFAKASRQDNSKDNLRNSHHAS